MINVLLDIGVEEQTIEEVEEVIKELGDGDRKISFNEFLGLIENVLEMMANADWKW